MSVQQVFVFEEMPQSRVFLQSHGQLLSARGER